MHLYSSFGDEFAHQILGHGNNRLLWVIAVAPKFEFQKLAECLGEYLRVSGLSSPVFIIECTCITDQSIVAEANQSAHDLLH
jgi:hypothetical protein